MDEYRTAFEQLNIEQGVFDQIIADEGARGEICECLMLCLTSVPSLREVASALLQYIACAGSSHSFDDEKWITPNGNHDNADGGPGSGNFGHSGVPGQVGGSAPAVSARVRDDLHAMSVDDKEEFLSREAGFRFRAIMEAEKAGTLDALIDEHLDKVTQDIIAATSTAADCSKIKATAVDVANEINGNDFETMVLFDKDGNEIGRQIGDATGVDGERGTAYSTVHNHPGDDASSFSFGDVRVFSKDDAEQVMYMASKSTMYCLQKCDGFEEYKGKALASHMQYLEHRMHEGDITREELIAQTDAYLQLHAHEHGLKYSQFPLKKKNTDGGPGSGNFGHAGVPGQVGGSAPGNGMTAEESAKVTSGLNDSLKKAVSSAKTREEKYYAAKKVISEAPVGSCVKVGFFEARKVVDGASPDEPAYSTGYDDTPSKSLSDLMHLVDYSGWGFEPEFVDGVAKKAQAREAVAQMREAGKISGSDEVRKGEEGLIASGSSKYGQPGSYAIYRTGEVSENGMVFFATTKEGADTYASQHDNKTSQYRAVLKNPLVVEGAGDGECLAKAHEILTGKKISGGLTDTKWIAADRQNASALASSGYDSIIYVVNGRPTEVQIPGATARSMTENIGTYSTTEWSRLGKTIEGAVYDDSFKQQPADYKRLDGKNLDSSEKPLDFKAQSATIKSKEDTAFDGAPKGNQNAAGPHKGGGSGHKLSQTERTKLENRFVGKKSSKGTEIKKFSEHAFERLGGRAISAGRFEKMLNSTDTKPDKNHPDRTLYDVPGSRMVLSDDGTVVSIMWRRQN